MWHIYIYTRSDTVYVTLNAILEHGYKPMKRDIYNDNLIGLMKKTSFLSNVHICI